MGDGAEDVAEELGGKVAPKQAVGAEARVGGHGDGEDPLLRPRAGIRIGTCARGRTPSHERPDAHCVRAMVKTIVSLAS